MSHADLKALGMSGGPSTNKIDPWRLFIVGLDGEGETEQARIDWLKGIFPKLESKIDALKDPRACAPVTDEQVAAFRPKHAGSVKYENMGVKFPDGCGRWSGLQFIAVNGGRQRTKTMRALNAKRVAEGSPALEIQVEGKRYENDMDRREGKAIENASIVQQSPMQRAWLAHELEQGGMKHEDIAPLVNVTSAQAVKNLIDLTGCSEAVQKAVDVGPDNGGITQTAALQIAKLKDHDKQDAELTKRLQAADGKKGRERSKALRGDQSGPKPMSANSIAKVTEKLSGIDRAGMADPHRVDDWVAILRIVSGDESAYDALPDEFREVLHRVRVGAASERAKRGKKAKASEKSGESASASEANDNSSAQDEAA